MSETGSHIVAGRGKFSLELYRLYLEYNKHASHLCNHTMTDRKIIGSFSKILSSFPKCAPISRASIWDF